MSEKNKKTIFWVALVLVCALAILSGILFAGCGKKAAGADLDELVKADAEVELAECYGCNLQEMYGDDQPNLLVYFWKETGTMAHAMGEDVAATGTFTVNGNEVITELKGKDSDEVIKTDRYILDGDYLLIGESMYDGRIPDEDTFEAECQAQDSSGMTIKYNFRKDGTYTCTEILAGKKEKDPIKLEGTYKRDGKLINRTLSGIDIMPFYVYEGRLFPSYYVKTEPLNVNMDNDENLSN